MLSSLNPFSNDSSASNKSTEASLTTILPTPDDRTELTLLVATIASNMQSQLTSCFAADATPEQDDDDVLPPPKPKRPDTTNTTAPQSEPEKQKREADERAWVEYVKADIAAQEKVKQELEKRKKELSTEKMQEMKRTASDKFEAWQQRVLQRVGEVVNSRQEQEHQQEKKTAPPKDDEAESAIAAKADAPEVDAALRKAYPPVETPLADLDRAKRALILHSMLLLMLSLESYSSWSRTLMIYLATSLRLPLVLLEEDEAKIATGLLQAVDMSGESSTKKAAEDNALSRKWKVGLATVAGAAIIGVTGGLAAPLLAAGVGSVMGGLGLGATATAGYLGTLAGSSVLVGGLFGAYGGKMTGEMIDAYAREVEDFAFIPLRDGGAAGKKDSDIKAKRRLRVLVGVSGWLTTKDDVDRPWRVLGPTTAESFALRFELSALLNLGNALTALLTSAAWGYAKSEILKRTIFATLTAAMWPLALLKVSRVIDNPFSVAKARADKAGEVLADAIINHAQGERPISLVGYSLGARVIYVCLKKLAERGAFGLVEDVVLLGAPTPSDTLDWRIVRATASGRVINVYSKEDYILGFLYRSSSIQLGVAGLQAVQGVKGVENIDYSDEVQGHNSWRWLVGKVLASIGFSDLIHEEVERQEREGRKVKKEQEEKREQAEKAEGKDELQTKAETEDQAAPLEKKTADMKIDDKQKA